MLKKIVIVAQNIQCHLYIKVQKILLYHGSIFELKFQIKNNYP